MNTWKNNKGEYEPDKWLVFKVECEQPFYKILGSWFGGYTGANSWRTNSGIAKVEKDGPFFLFYGESGSVYRCHEENYGAHMLARSIIQKDYFEELEEQDWTKFDF